MTGAIRPFLMIGISFLGRLALDILCGYKYRAFVPNSSAQIT